MPSPLRTFLRPADGRVAAGVAAALARRSGVDVTWIRGALVVLTLVVALAGVWAVAAVVAAYGFAALAIPAESATRP